MLGFSVLPVSTRLKKKNEGHFLCLILNATFFFSCLLFSRMEVDRASRKSEEKATKRSESPGECVSLKTSVDPDG